MQYRTMRSTGDDLSVLGAGAMRLPGKRGGIDEQRARTQLYRLIDAGVNYIDTAWAYHAGASEPFLGRILTGTYRDRVHIATKLPYWMADTRADMDRLLDIQLDRLNTDCIEYYLIHNIGGASWEKMLKLGLIDFMDRAKQSGRVRHLGFSSHVGTEDFKTVVDGYDWQLCQLQYNYLDEFAQAGTEGLEYAASKGLGIIIMEPLRGGSLTKSVPPSIQAIWDEAPVKRSPAEWGLRWVWNRPEVHVVLSGMNQEAHIEENLRIADAAHANSLTEEELALIARVAEQYRRLMPVGCTGCGYCMPCPAGVDIPACFALYNDLRMFDQGLTAKLKYALYLSGMLEQGNDSYASLCVNCGKCVEACPQHLPIPGLLKDVSRAFEGIGSTLMKWLAMGVIRIDRFFAMRRAGRER